MTDETALPASSATSATEASGRPNADQLNTTATSEGQEGQQQGLDMLSRIGGKAPIVGDTIKIDYTGSPGWVWRGGLF